MSIQNHANHCSNSLYLITNTKCTPLYGVKVLRITVLRIKVLSIKVLRY